MKIQIKLEVKNKNEKPKEEAEKTLNFISFSFHVVYGKPTKEVHFCIRKS